MPHSAPDLYVEVSPEARIGYLAILTVDGVSTLLDYSHGRLSGPIVTVP